MQLCRFLAVGLLNTIIGYSIFAFLTILNFGVSTALVLTYAIGVPMNYVTTGKMVFFATNQGAFPRFLLSYVAIYFVNLAALGLLMHCFPVDQLLAQAIIVPFVAVLSFVVFRKFVFRTP